MASVRSSNPIALSSQVSPAVATPPASPLVVVVSPPAPPPMPFLPPMPAATLLSDATLGRGVNTKPATAAKDKEPFKLLPKLDLNLVGYSATGAVLGSIFHAGKVFSEEGDPSHTLYKYRNPQGDTFFYKADRRYYGQSEGQLTKALPVAVYKAPKSVSATPTLGVDLDRPIAQYEYPFQPLQQKGWNAPFVNLFKPKAPFFYSDQVKPSSVVVLEENGQTAKQVISFLGNGVVEVVDKKALTKEAYKPLAGSEGFILTHRYTMGAKGWQLNETHVLKETIDGLKVQVFKAGKSAKEWLTTNIKELTPPLEAPIIKTALTDFPIQLPALAQRVESFVSWPLLRNMFNLQGLAKYSIIGGAMAMVAGLLTATSTSTKVDLAFNQS